MDNTKKASIDYLVSVGLLIPFSKLELYHGRANTTNTEWRVDPTFNNAGNNTGNRNVYEISILSTGPKSLAQDYAQYRADEIGSGATAEVHRILPYDKDAMFFNANVSLTQYTPEQIPKIIAALKAISVPSVTMGSPIKFENRKAAKEALNVCKITLAQASAIGIPYITNNMVEQMQRENPNLPKDLLEQISAAVNTRNLILRQPELAMYAYEQGIREISPRAGKASIFCPFSSEYLAYWLSQNHIVGLRKAVKTPKFGGKQFNGYYIFDISKVNTEKVVGQRYAALMQMYGGATPLLNDFMPDTKLMEELKTSSPQQTMQLITDYVKCHRAISLPAGVWEGFTVGEHTETVLRVFEDSFGQDIPQDLMPFMKVALFAHDLGRGSAYAKGIGQKEENRRFATKLFDKLGMSAESATLAHFIIGEGQEYTTDYYVKKNPQALPQLLEACKKELTVTYGREPTKAEIDALSNMCRVVQTCDSGAYTRHAVTRDSQDGFYYHNGNDRFTDNTQALGINHDHIRLKNPPKPPTQ